MTQYEYEVFQWLVKESDFNRKVKCSGPVIARELGLTPGQVEEILDQLEEENYIFLVRRKDYKHPKIYRIEKSQSFVSRPRAVSRAIYDLEAEENERQEKSLASHFAQPGRHSSSIYPKQKTIKLQGLARVREDFVKRVAIKNNLHVHDQPSVKTRRVLPTRGDVREGNNERDIRNTQSDIRYKETERQESNARSRLPVLQRLPFLSLAQPKKKDGPFARFAGRKRDCSEWNAQDIVCYYAHLFRLVYRSWPRVIWGKDTKAAVQLLEAFGQDREQVKLYLQMAFGFVKSSYNVGGLHWFLQDWIMNKVIEKQDHNPDLAYQAADEFRDQAVFA